MFKKKGGRSGRKDRTSGFGGGENSSESLRSRGRHSAPKRRPDLFRGGSVTKGGGIQEGAPDIQVESVVDGTHQSMVEVRGEWGKA